MSIRYESLDVAVRAAMVRELEQDLTNGTLYISPRLTEAGAQAWPQILREAAEQHDDAWIASTLRSRSLMRTEEQRRKPKGGFTTAKVPHTAPDTLAEGEFNRLYARGLCADVLASGGAEVEVYRGKNVQNPRPEYGGHDRPAPARREALGRPPNVAGSRTCARLASGAKLWAYGPPCVAAGHGRITRQCSGPASPAADCQAVGRLSLG